MRLIVSSLLCITLFACGGGSSSDNTNPVTPTNPGVTTPSYQPQSSEIEVGTFSEVGVDEDVIAAAYLQAESQSWTRSLLVLKQDKLLAEQYFNGQTAQQLQHVRSVTKTVTGLLTGIAIDHGLLSMDSTLGEFFHDEYSFSDADAESVTVAQLLTMTSGFEWDESGATLYVEWAQSDEPVDFLLSRNLSSAPGEAFTYNSAAVHVLGAIVSKVTQSTLRDFAMERLFQPMGIDSIRWEILADSRYNGGAGLELRPIDQARLGLLIQNNGTFTNADGSVTQVVPEHWVVEMKQEHVTLSGTYSAMDYRGYGYLNWLGASSALPDSDADFELAWGWGGQFILTHPSSDMVLISNSDWSVDGSQAGEQQRTMLNILIDGIINVSGD